MRQFKDYISNMAYPVIDFRRSSRYINGERTEILDSRYTVLHNYEQITIVVADDGNVVTSDQVKNAADAGTPIVMEFKDLEITIRPKDRWEIQASGRASHAVVRSKGK